MVFPVLVGVVGIAAATVCVVSLDDDSLTVKLKTTDKTRIFYLTKKTLSQKVLLLWEKILRFFSFFSFSLFSSSNVFVKILSLSVLFFSSFLYFAPLH
tara:strand:- start:611 stop:904 length:294 start_codon:yes stop_codon:yes gene_type:complete